MTTTATATRYAIVRTRSFYGSSDKRDRHEGPDSTWASLAAARAEIRRLESSTYCQSHNEYGRASYKAVRVDRLPAILA
jgi:hypothetical protein